jgi:hypothetical protein
VMVNSSFLEASLSGPPKYFQTSQGDGLSTATPFIPSIAIVDGSGTQITSFGGGTQYADGVTQATPTGTVALGKNSSNVLHAVSLDGSGNLNVNVAAGGASGGTSSSFGAAFPATGTASGFSDGTNMQAARVFDGDTGAGTEYSTGVILRKSASGGTVEAGTSSNPLRTDPTGTTAQPITDNGGSLTVDNGGTFAVQATVAAAATNIAKAEDTASADADVGVPSMAIRKATPANTSGTDGDYEMLQMSAGRLWTSATIDAALPTGANTIGSLAANQSVNVAQINGGTTSTVATGVQKVGIADSGGTAFLSAANALNSTGGGIQAAQIVGQFDDTSPTSITENQFGNLRMSANRNAYTTLRDAAGNERGANINASNQLSVSVDNTAGVNVAQVNGGTTSTVATGVQKVGIADSGGTAFLSAANALNSTGAGIQTAQLVGQFDDTSPTSITENQFGNIRMSANRNIYDTIRDAAGNERGLNISANNAASVAGDIANDAADSGNPLKVGGVARQTNPTAVTDGDRVNCFRDDVGRQIAVLNQCRDLTSVQQTTITSSTSETTIVTAIASTFVDLVQLTITNSSATALIVTLKDSTAGTTRGIYALAANGGIVIPFPTPLPQATVNNNWTLTCGTSVASIYVVAEYVKNV